MTIVLLILVLVVLTGIKEELRNIREIFEDLMIKEADNAELQSDT